MTFFGNRRKRLLSLAKDSNIAVQKPENLFYLCGFFGGAVGVVKPDRTVVVTTALEAERAKSLSKEAEVVQVQNQAALWEAVQKNLQRGTCYTDEDAGGRKRFVSRNEIFLNARRKKDEEEIRRIGRASEILDKIFEMLEEEIKVGRTEREIAAEILRMATLEGATGSGFRGSLSPTILASGENGALPHAELTDRRIRPGDFTIADLTFRYEGYNSDATRTFAVKEVSRKMRAHYEAVLEAQVQGVGLSVQGSKCGEVDEGVRSVLRKRSLIGNFIHGTGHGVGIDAHELPNISRGSEVRLESDDVVTVEPGVYFPGKYGIRIEDTLLVRKTPELLTRYSRELATVG